jgi:hypothetical protein
MVSSGKLRRVTLVRTNVSEELSSSFIRVTRIGELGTTLAATSNRRTLRRNTKGSVRRLLVKLVLFLFQRFWSPWWRRLYDPPKRRSLLQPHSVTSQKTPFFIVTDVNTSNLTSLKLFKSFLHPTYRPNWPSWTKTCPSAVFVVVCLSAFHPCVDVLLLDVISFHAATCPWQNSGRWTKSRNPLILSFTHHRQSPVDSTNDNYM